MKRPVNVAYKNQSALGAVIHDLSLPKDCLNVRCHAYALGAEGSQNAFLLEAFTSQILSRALF